MNVLFILGLLAAGAVYVGCEEILRYLATKRQFKQDWEEYEALPFESIFSEELWNRNGDLQMVKAGVMSLEFYRAKYNLPIEETDVKPS